MTQPDTLSVDLPAGRLRLTVHDGPPVAELCDVAARANPRRGFLIVSKVLGRHLPARPDVMRASMAQLAAKLPPDLPEPVVFLGMAETATALGQGVFAAFRRQRPGVRALYLQTSRQLVAGAETLATFEEGHSHASTHLVQIRDKALGDLARSARSLVIVDDECSTGKTFVAAVAALRPVLPGLERVATVCITDWSGGGYCADIPLATARCAILDGVLDWTADPSAPALSLASGVNRQGTAPQNGMASRTGLREPEAAVRAEVTTRPGERVLVLGDGEHSYEALRIAEAIEAQGGVAAVQSITRSPVLPGYAMRTVSRFDDAYGSGAACYLYNLVAHAPDRIVIATEVEGDQIAQARAALAELGADLPVELVLCRYRGTA